MDFQCGNMIRLSGSSLFAKATSGIFFFFLNIDLIYSIVLTMLIQHIMPASTMNKSGQTCLYKISW